MAISSNLEFDAQNKVSKNNSCGLCSLNKICFTGHVSDEISPEIEDIIVRHQLKCKNDNWFDIGDKASSIIAVRSGSVKTYQLNEDGNEQVCDFHLPGELIGLDSISTGTHMSYVSNLEDSSICEIPLKGLQELSKKDTTLVWELARLMSQHLESKQRHINLLSKRNAEERIVAFLCDLSDRLTKRGLSGSQIRLNMSRSDIAHYLGLTLETISRVFSRLAKEGLILVKGKEVVLLEISSLKDKLV